MEIKHKTDKKKNQVRLKLMDGVGEGKGEVVSELPPLSSQCPPLPARLLDTPQSSRSPAELSWNPPHTHTHK